MMKGNKGEWSEIYVFLKLLAEGRLNAADSNLDLLPGIYYPIIKILREESVPDTTRDDRQNLEYVIESDNIVIVSADSNTILLTISVNEFIEKSKALFNELKSAKGRSVSFPDIEIFLNSIHVQTLKARSCDKSDIQLVVHDLRTGMAPKLGFSIKSSIGKNSTLFNPGRGTNFIYEVTVPDNIEIDINDFNQRTLAKPKIVNRVLELRQLGCDIRFRYVQSEVLQKNLRMIDSLMPEIISHLLCEKYDSKESNINSLIDIICTKNPLIEFAGTDCKDFYRYKTSCFLEACALGMTPEKLWSGHIDATGGIIVVKETGDLVCYHLYNRNEFHNYLFNNTCFEQASTGEDEDNPGHERVRAKPYYFGWLYEESGKLYIKLNLQIRFR